MRIRRRIWKIIGFLEIVSALRVTGIFEIYNGHYCITYLIAKLHFAKRYLVRLNL